MQAPLSGSIDATSPEVARSRLYYGWVNVAVAAVAMTATLPGRTHGLGLITKPLTDDPTLGVGEARFSDLNFWAILIGSVLCLPAGRLIDRWGARSVLVAVSLGLGLAVVWMSRVESVLGLFIALVLIRGLGQGALSVVSIALVGKWFTRRLGPAMGMFTVLLAFGFIGSTVGLGESVKAFGWRESWWTMGMALLLGMAPLGWLLAQLHPLRMTTAEITSRPPTLETVAVGDLTLKTALCSPAFWVFTLAMGLFNLVWSAITLFNESILEEHQLRDSFVLVMAVLVFAGLPTNLVAGWLSTRWSMGRLLSVGMVTLGLSLATFPWVTTPGQAIAYSAGMGVAGGIVTVVFFAVYGHAFGRTHLGAIQGAAQVVSVLASAIGPVLFTRFKGHFGSSDPLFLYAAAATVVFAVGCWIVRLPSRPQIMASANV